MPYTPVVGVEVLEQSVQYDFQKQRGPYSYWDEQVRVIMLMSNAWNIRPEQNYDMYGKVFGYSSPGAIDSGSVEHLVPLAKDRGLPADMSVLLKLNHKDCGATKGETWISWQELQALDLADIQYRTGNEVVEQWWMLYEIMAMFARRYGGDGVRLIAWWSK